MRQRIDVGLELSPVDKIKEELMPKATESDEEM